MLGRTYTYSFSDIQGLRRNNDSLTLFVAGKKVHIEAMALISERFIILVDRALEKNGLLQASDVYYYIRCLNDELYTKE